MSPPYESLEDMLVKKLLMAYIYGWSCEERMCYQHQDPYRVNDFHVLHQDISQCHKNGG